MANLYAARVERSEMARLADDLLALARAPRAQREEFLGVLRGALDAERDDERRAVAAHGLVRLLLGSDDPQVPPGVVTVPVEVRYRAAAALRAAAEAAGEPDLWSYAALGRLLGVSRAMAQSVLRRPRGRSAKH